MQSRHFKEVLRRRRWIALPAAFLLVAGLTVAVAGLAAAGGTKRIEYTFVFEHTDGTTSTVTGTATENDTFIADAGGTSATNPSGMIVHVSCSDPFTGGWGVKQGPSPVADPEWHILSYYIAKYEGDQLKNSCGTPLPPPPPPNPAIDIEKATNGEDADLPTGPQVLVGSTVTWTFVVTNTGNTALSSVAVVDDKEGAITCPKDSLAIGESMTCTKQGIAQLGQYANVAEVTAVGPGAAANVPLNSGIGYSFLFEHTNGTTTLVTGTATSNDTFVAGAGGTSATNPTGMMMHVSCSDPFTGGWGVKLGPDPVADPEWHIRSFYIAKYDNGEIKKSCGTPIPSTKTVRDSDPSHYIGVPGNPGIDIEKYTNGDDADLAPGPTLQVGSTVTWTYVVTNTGALDLFNVAVDDDKEGFIGTIAFLPVGGRQTLTHQGRVQRGAYENTGCVVGYTQNGVEVTDCDPSHYTPPCDDYDPCDDVPDPDNEVSIDLEKATNGADADQATGPRVPVGSTVTWTYVITNTGDQWLWGVFLYDEEEGRVTCPNRSLAPGQSMTCQLTGAAVAGQYANEAWVTGWGDNGTQVSDRDWSHYFGGPGGDEYPEPSPGSGINLEAAVNGQDADQATGPRIAVGSSVSLTYVITNTGSQWLWGIFLYDEGQGRVSCPSRSLAPGQSMTCRLTRVAVAGQYAYEAWVDAWGNDGTQISDIDWNHYFGYRAN